MSKSTSYIQNDREVSKYIDTMVKHAEKHGIKIMALVATMPMINRSVCGITHHGKDDLRECSSRINDLQIQVLRLYDDRRTKMQIAKIDDFLDDLCGDENDD